MGLWPLTIGGKPATLLERKVVRCKSWALFSGTRQMEQLSLHCPQKIVATEDSSALREEMRALEPQEENAKARNLIWKPMSWLGHISPKGPEAAWVLPLWQTFVCTALGVPVPVLAALPTQPNLPRVKCGCKQFDLDFYGDHVSTCIAHAGATKSHDWMVGQLRPLFQTTGHKVKTQGITQSSGLKRGDLEIINYLQDAAGKRNLVIDVSITHDRIGSSKSNPHLNGTLSHPNAPDAPLNQAAQRKVHKYRNAYANNHTISFLPAITSTSTRMHGEFLRLIFLQAHRETEDYFRFTGVSAQHTTDMFRYRRAAFYSGLKSKVGLIAAKTAALRVNMNTDGCLLASHVASHFPPTSHAPSLLISSLSHHVRPPCMY